MTGLTLTEARREYERLKALDKAFFVPTDVAAILGCESYTINLAARDQRSLLGFPFMLTGRRVKIPRAAFLDYIQRNVLGYVDADTTQDLWKKRAYDLNRSPA